MPKVAATITGAIAFGRRCRKMSRAVAARRSARAPIDEFRARAARAISPRNIRAIGGQPSSPITSIML